MATSRIEIDHDTDFLVSGYIRQYEAIVSNIVPPLVVHTCLIFYHLNEWFESIGDNVKISENKCLLTRTKGGIVGCSHFGAIKIKSTDGGIYKWTIKAFQNIIVGVSNQKSTDSPLYFKGPDVIYYAFSKDTKMYNNNGYPGMAKLFKCNVDVTQNIGVILDLNKKQVSFECEVPKNKAVAFQDIKVGHDIHYRFFVAMFGSGDKVQLIKFEQIGMK